MDTIFKKQQSLDSVSVTIWPLETISDWFLFQDQVMTLIKSVDYIWHKNPLTFKVDESCLRGSCVVGDGVLDEWFIVSLLLSISSSLKVAIQLFQY